MWYWGFRKTNKELRNILSHVYYYMSSTPMGMIMWLLIYIIYDIMFNDFDFQGCGLSTKHVVADPFHISFFPTHETVGHYRLVATICPL